VERRHDDIVVYAVIAHRHTIDKHRRRRAPVMYEDDVGTLGHLPNEDGVSQNSVFIG